MRVIYIVNGKGGVGKSTVSAQMAAFLSMLGYRVGIIDTDDPQHTFLNWFKQRETTDIVGWEIAFEDIPIHLDDLKSGRKFDYVLVDTAGRHSQRIADQFNLADLVVMPVQPSIPDVSATELSAKVLADKGIATIIVLNRALANDKDTLGAVLRLSDTTLPVSKAILYQRKAYQRCMAFGVSAWVFDPKAPCLDEYKTFWNDVLDKFPKMKLSLPKEIAHA